MCPKWTFFGCSDPWLPTNSIFSHIHNHSHLKLFDISAKHVLTVRELFSIVVNKIIFQNMIMACKIPPPHCKCHLKIPFFGRLPLGRPKFRHCLPLFCFHACSIWFDFCNHEQSKTKWKRHLEHCLWYGSFSRPKFRHCLLFFLLLWLFTL